jgi:hypothetical protein
MTEQTKATACIAGQPRSKMTCDYCGSSGVQPCTGRPWNANPIFRVRTVMAERSPRWTGRTQVHERDYVRYADAAAHFWGAVAMQPDDGWDAFGGGVRPADVNAYDLRREGKDWTRGGTAWRVALEVIA